MIKLLLVEVGFYVCEMKGLDFYGSSQLWGKNDLARECSGISGLQTLVHYQIHLEDLLKNRLPGSTARVSDLMGLGNAWEFVFLSVSSVMLILGWAQ